MTNKERGPETESTSKRIVEVRVVNPPKQPESRFRPWFDTVAKWLPWAAIFVFGFIFRAEISTLLHSAGKFEAFGFKWERSTFEARVVAADRDRGNGQGISLGNPLLADLFRRMNLAAPGLRGMKVLWVDDHPENNFSLRRVLTDYGANVTIAMSTQEAFNLANRTDFDLVLSDFGRDNSTADTGAKFADWLANQAYGAPVLFYTSSPSRVPKSVPGALVTNNPTALLAHIAQIGLDRMAGIAPRQDRFEQDQLLR